MFVRGKKLLKARRRPGGGAGSLVPSISLFIAIVISRMPAFLFPMDLQEASARSLPSGTIIYLRLETPAGTKTSHLRDPIKARVVRDVPLSADSTEVAIPVGAKVSGTIERLIPSSSPTDRARMRLQFTQLELPGLPPVPITGHLVGVENARETVLADGTIRGVLASELPISMLEDALDKLKKSRPDVGDQAKKTSEERLGKSDTSIEYPAGTDLIFALDKPPEITQAFPPAAGSTLSSPVSAPVARLLEEAPQRASGKDGKPGDPLNLVIIGDAAGIRRVFQEGGWAEAEKLTGKSLFETVRAVMGDKGYGSAPVSQLYLYGRAEDLAFQKMLNTFAKRHHLRLWRSPAKTEDGREIWLGAATHDIGMDVRPGVVSHAIDPEIDKERDKVGADLAATGRVAILCHVTRPNPLSEGMTATGGNWKTDGRLLAIELKSP